MDAQILIIAIIWIINLGISWLNARTVGLMWVETKYIGGWKRFMAWMGAIMSASGFTWCYLLVLLLGAYYLQPVDPDKSQLLTPDMIQGGFALGYIIILPGILFSGMMIWIDSLVQAWKRRDARSIGTAAWNSFAQMHNMYSAMKGMPEVWKSIGKLTDKGSGKSKGVILIFILVLLALVGGVLTTWSIINRYAGTRPLKQSAKQTTRFAH